MAPTSTAVFRAVADFASLNREVGKTRREIASLQAQAGQTGGWDKFNAALTKVTEGQGALRKETAALGTAQTNLGKTLDTQSGRLTKYETSIKKTATTQASLRKETDALAKSQKSLGGGISGLSSLEKAMRSLADAQDRARTSAGSLNSAYTNQGNTLKQAQSLIKDTASASRDLAVAEDRATKSAQNHAKSLGDERDAARTKVTALSALAEGLRRVQEREDAAIASSKAHVEQLHRETAASIVTANQHKTLAAETTAAGRAANTAGGDHDILRESMERVRASATGTSSGLNQHATALRGVGSASTQAASGQQAAGAAIGQIGQLYQTGTGSVNGHSTALRTNAAAAQQGSSAHRNYASSIGGASTASRGASSSVMALSGALNPLRSGMRNAGEAGAGLRTILTVLVPTTAAVGIQLLVQSLSSLIAGLVSIVGAAGPAVGALAALGPAALAAAGGVATAMLSFRGVGDALSAMVKLDNQAGASGTAAASQRVAAARAVGSAQRSLRDAVQGQQDAEQQGIRAVTDAQRTLDRARADAGRAAEAAARQVADANRDLERSNQAVLRAEQDLHDARRQAIRDLEDLAERVSDNSLSQESAEIRLLRAQERLNEVNQDATSTALDRREAALAVKEAEDNLSDSLRQAGRDQTDYNAAQQGGVNGMPGVVSAQDSLSSALQSQSDAAQRLSDAQRDAALSQQDSSERVADAERNLAEAREDAARRNRDAAERVADAQLALAEAQSKLTEEQGAGSAAARALAQAWEKLSPAGQRLVNLLHDLIPQVDKMSKAGQEAFFPGLIDAINTLVPMIDTVAIPLLTSFGAVMGSVARDAASEIRSWEADLIGFGTGAGPDLISKFGDILINLASAAMDVSMAAAPMTQWLFDMARQLSLYWKTEAEAARGDGRLADYFERVRATLELLGSILYNLGSILGSVLGSAAPAGERLLRSFDALTDRTRKWMDSVEGKNRLQEYFDKAEPNVRIILDLLGQLGLAFIKAGESTALTKMLESIRDVLAPSISRFFGELSQAIEEVGPGLISLLAGVLDFFSTLMEQGTGGGLAAFIGVIGGLVDLLNFLVAIPFAATIMGWVSALVGASVALRAIHKLITGVAGAIPGASLLNQSLAGPGAAQARNAAGKPPKGSATTFGQGMKQGVTGVAPGPPQSGTARVGQALGGAARNVGTGVAGAFSGGSGGAHRSGMPGGVSAKSMLEAAAAAKATSSALDGASTAASGFGSRAAGAGSAASTAFGRVSGAVQSAGAAAAGTARSIGDGFRNTANAVGGYFAGTGKQVGAGMLPAQRSSETVGGAIKQNFQSAASTVGGTFTKAGSSISDVMSRAGAKIGDAATGAANVAKRAAGDTLVGWSNAADKVGASWSGTGQQVGAGMVPAATTASQVTDRIKSSFSTAATAVTSTTTSAASAVSTRFSDAATRVGGAFSSAATRVGTALAPIATSATNVGRDAYTGMKSWADRIGGTWVGAYGGATTAANSASQGVTRATRQMADESERSGSRIGNAFRSMTASVGSTVSGLTTSLSGIGGAARKAGDDVDSMSSRAAAAGTGGMGALRGAASSLVGFLGGPWGIALVAAGALLAIFTSQMAANQEASRQSKTAQEDFKQALDESRGALDANVRSSVEASIKARTLAGSDDALVDAAKRAGVSVGDMTSAVMNQGPALDGVRGRLQETIDAHKRFRGEAGSSIAGNGMALDEVGRAAQGTLVEIDKLTAEFHAQELESIQLRAALNGVNVEQQKMIDGTIRARDELLASLDADLQKKQSLLDIRDAQKFYNDQVAQYGVNSDEASAADIRLQQTMLGHITQAGEAAAKQAELNGVLDTTNARLAGQNQAALDLAATHTGPLPEALQKIIAGMDASALSAAGARLRIDETNTAIVTLPGGKEIKLTDNAPDTVARLREVEAALKRIQDKADIQLRVQQGTATGEDYSRLKNDFAGGGVVPGYSPGKDTVPAVLSPGEAVLVPELVKKIGARNILAANAQASGRPPQTFGGTAHFAGGGIVGQTRPTAQSGTGVGGTTAPAPIDASATSAAAKAVAALTSRMTALTPEMQAAAAAGIALSSSSLQPLASRLGGDVLDSLTRLREGGLLPLRSDLALTQQGTQVATQAMTGAMQLYDAQANAALESLRASGLAPLRTDLTTTQQHEQTSTTAMTNSMNLHRDLSNAAMLNIRTLGLNPLRTDLTTTQLHEQTATTAMTTAMNLHRDLSNAAMLNIRTLGMLPFRGDMTTTQEGTAVNTSLMSGAVEVFRDRANQALLLTRDGLAQTRTSVGETQSWWSGQMDLMKVNAQNPVRDVLNGPFNGGIIAAWNSLNGQFALGKPVNPVAVPFATGGKVPGTGNQDTVPAVLTPGEFVLSKKAIDGLGGLGNVERMHQMARMGIIGPNQNLGSGSADGRARQQMMRQVPLDGPIPFAYGGVVPHVAVAGDEITRVLGRMPGGIGGVGARANASDHPKGLALDFMTMSDQGLGDRVAQHLLGNAARLAVKYLIWKQSINSGSGWRGMEDRGSVTANHFDHVHASFLGAGIAGSAFAGGGAFFDPGPIVETAFADTYKMLDDIAAKYPNEHAARVVAIGRQAADMSKAKALETVRSIGYSAPVGATPPPQAFANGGFVPGRGKGDTQPAMLTPGEFVLRRSAADALGSGTLGALNALSPGAFSPNAAQYMALGGVVQKSTGPAYRVKRGDTLSGIARAYGSSVSELQKLNKIANANKIYAGSWLNLPKKSTSSNSNTASSSEIVQAAKAILDRIKSGKQLYEDWTWSGAPSIVGKHNDTLLEKWRVAGGGSNTDFLQKFVSSNGSTTGGNNSGGSPGTPATTPPAGDASAQMTLAQWADAMQKNTKDTKEFEGNLLKLSGWGYDDLALALAKMGMDSVGTDNAGGLVLSREAVKSPSEAARIEKIVEDSKTVIGANLESALAIIGALRKKTGLGIREVSTESKVDTKSIFDTLSASSTVLAEIGNLPAANKDKFLSNWTAYKAGLPFALGGRVPGTGRGDTVPAMLTPGEFVLRKDAAHAIGVQGLQQLNRADSVPTQAFAAGGEVLRAEDLFSFGSSPSLSRPGMGRAVQDRLAKAAARSGDTANSKSVVFNEGAVQVHNPAPARTTDSFEGIMRKLSWSGTFS